MVFQHIPSDAELTLRALQRRNVTNRIMHVNDGAEASDWIFATGHYSARDVHNKPKVVLLDLKLPKMDGLEVLRRIRGSEEMKLLPVVVLTSSREDRDIIETYKLGVNSYIVKPVSFDNFSQAVAEAGDYWVLLNQEPNV